MVLLLKKTLPIVFVPSAFRLVIEPGHARNRRQLAARRNRFSRSIREQAWPYGVVFASVIARRPQRCHRLFLGEGWHAPRPRAARREILSDGQRKAASNPDLQLCCTESNYLLPPRRAHV